MLPHGGKRNLFLFQCYFSLFLFLLFLERDVRSLFIGMHSLSPVSDYQPRDWKEKSAKKRMKGRSLHLSVGSIVISVLFNYADERERKISMCKSANICFRRSCFRGSKKKSQLHTIKKIWKANSWFYRGIQFYLTIRFCIKIPH